MAKSYVKFSVAPEVAGKAYELVQVASSTGKVRRGTNEATKAIERGTAKIVIIAENVEPEEIVMHLPDICAEKGIPFLFVPDKKELGKYSGMDVQSAAIAVENPGNGGELLKELLNHIPKKA
jgi:large subunit ribosomal protein L7Ae